MFPCGDVDIDIFEGCLFLVLTIFFLILPKKLDSYRNNIFPKSRPAFVTEKHRKFVLALKKVISTSERCVEHPFTDRYTQQ